MFVIIVGAGRTGSRVVELATGDGHDVVVIEEQAEPASYVSQNYDCVAIHDDGTSRDVLIEADIEGADALIATTDEDALNLLVMMHGRDFEVPALVSRVNDVTNIRLYQQLGVHTVESPHRLNGEYLYRSVQRPMIRDFMTIGEDAEVFEITVDEGALLAGYTLDEAGRENLLPEDAIVVAIQRGDDVLIPRGKTRLKTGDLVTVFSKVGATPATTRPFLTED